MPYSKKVIILECVRVFGMLNKITDTFIWKIPEK